MAISREDLSRHYASLPDGELLALDPSELTDLALECYEREVERRHVPEEAEADGEVSPDWLESAAIVCSFRVGGGRRYAEDPERACAILRDAGIPSQASSEHQDDGSDFLNIMVPSTLNLKALSILDRDLFNEEMEESWRAHFDELSDKELRALHPDDLCAGLLDRAARLKRVYGEALAKRKAAVAAQ